MLQLKDLEARVDSDPDKIDSISPHPRRFLAKSVESSENKRVEFSVDAKNDKRVRKQQEVKEIDEGNGSKGVESAEHGVSWRCPSHTTLRVNCRRKSPLIHPIIAYNHCQLLLY